METRANYVMIGLFTLGVIAAGFLFVLWAAGRDSRALVPYRIMFSGSVSGLSRGSFVLYNGLKIGEVTSIALSSSDPGKVIAWVSVDSKTPINDDTRARLEFQGCGLNGNDVGTTICVPGQPLSIVTEFPGRVTFLATGECNFRV